MTDEDILYIKEQIWYITHKVEKDLFGARINSYIDRDIEYLQLRLPHSGYITQTEITPDEYACAWYDFDVPELFSDNIHYSACDRVINLYKKKLRQLLKLAGADEKYVE